MQIFSFSNLAVAYTVVLALPALATTAPTVTPGSGTYYDRKTSVTISGAPGDSLCYTTNGTTPNSGSTPYTVPISIGATATFKAIAYSGGSPSAVTTAYIQSDGTTLPVSRKGLELWLKGEIGFVSEKERAMWWQGRPISQNRVTIHSTPPIIRKRRYMTGLVDR
jgi:hypothetical protein